AEVIEEIETSHHVYLKQELPALQEILDRLADEAEGGPAAAPALELRRALSAMAVEINEHLFKEERILFPTILRIEAALGGEGRIDQSIFGCGTKGPIDHMHYEHKQAKGGLERIDEALRALEATGTVAEATAMLRPRLERLHDDLLEHIRAEEEDLFPRALGLEAQALAQVGQAPPDSGGRG
ncbi:MAG: hemerythrin domain-containing protein, partial [bacterium]